MILKELARHIAEIRDMKAWEDDYDMCTYVINRLNLYECPSCPAWESVGVCWNMRNPNITEESQMNCCTCECSGIIADCDIAKNINKSKEE